MRRSLGIAFLVSGALIATTVVVASVPPSVLSEASVMEAAGLDSFLGFDIGEERRYVIAPDDAMRDGEEATWSVLLSRVESVGGRSVGVFTLAHEERRLGIGTGGPMFVEWKYSGEARINEFGFPEEVRFSMFEEHTGEAPWRGEFMSASYTFDGREYVKDVRVPDQQWEFKFPIATHGDLDLDVPSGMFLFRPQAADIDFFTNPALLGFILPELIPESWEQRVLLFRPTYPVRHPDADYVRFERDTREALGRYYVKRTLKMGATTELEIGGRVLNVRQLDISGPLRTAYVDEFGRVVRIDLDPDPITRKNRHIRLLFPSEY